MRESVEGVPDTLCHISGEALGKRKRVDSVAGHWLD
jgi:hypothetical protein